MTKIPTANIDAFLHRPDRNYRVILLYGPNTGLLSHRLKNLKHVMLGENPSPFACEDVLYEEVKELRNLHDRLSSMGLGCSHKWLVIRDMPASVPADHRKALGSVSEDVTVLLVAGELTPQSSLRQWAEKDKTVAVIPAYKEDMQDVHRHIQQFARESRLQMTQEVQRELASRIGGDYAYTAQSLGRLRLYLGERTHVTIDDIYACFREPGEVTLDQCCAAFAMRKHGDLVRLWDQLMLEGVAVIAVLRSLYRYISRLRDMHQMMRVGGKTEDQAMAALKPPVFFKQKNQMRSDMKLWSLERCHAMLAEIAAKEAETKEGHLRDVPLAIRQWLSRV